MFLFNTRTLTRSVCLCVRIGLYVLVTHQLTRTVWLFLLAGILPLAILIAWAILLRPGVHKAHVTTLGLFVR